MSLHYSHRSALSIAGSSRRGAPAESRYQKMKTAWRFDNVAVQPRLIRPSFQGNLAMSVFKSGDLVVLKSGGPTMTVDAVNTSIFDDNKITGVVCAWFVGRKLERFRFEPGALEPANPREVSPASPHGDVCLESPEEYTVALDSMTGAMNTPPDRPEQAEVAKAAPKRHKGPAGSDTPKHTH
jgi:uncharacterized protein YodC (DUF2158 family)